MLDFVSGCAFKVTLDAEGLVRAMRLNPIAASPRRQKLVRATVQFAIKNGNGVFYNNKNNNSNKNNNNSSNNNISNNNILLEALTRELASINASNFAEEFLLEFLIASTFKAMKDAGIPQSVVDCLPSTSSKGDVEVENPNAVHRLVEKSKINKYSMYLFIPSIFFFIYLLVYLFFLFIYLFNHNFTGRP